MDIIKENVLGTIHDQGTASSKTDLKQTKSKKHTKKRALADVGNTIHQLKKNAVELVKNSDLKKKKCDAKQIKKSCGSESTYRKIPLSPTPGIKVAANLSPCYYYDSEDEDGHDFCSEDKYDDNLDGLLPLNLRLNDDDFDSLSMLKPRANDWKPCWNDFSVATDGSDFDDLNVPFPSPEKKHINLDLPFNEFIVPGINLDFSF